MSPFCAAPPLCPRAVVSGFWGEGAVLRLPDCALSWFLRRRLLLSIRESVQHVDYALNRELAFQEGVRHAQLVAGSSSSSFSWFLSIASTAALASTCTAYLLLRRNALH